MTRINKIIMLKERGYEIEYHYRCGENYRRLVIDKVKGLSYNTTRKDQLLAGFEIDDMFEEAFGNE